MKKEMKFKIKNRLVKITLYAASTIITTKGAFKLQSVFYSKDIKEYKEIVEDFHELLEEENIENPTDIFDYYNYALWNGYLSSNHKFEFDSSRTTVTDHPGMVCLTGKGVCYNNSGMLEDLYESYGYDAYNVVNYVDPENIKLEFIRTSEDITRNIAESDSESNPFLEKILDKVGKVFGNHAITCVEYNGEYYFYCPTQLAYLDKTSRNDVELIGCEGAYKLKYLSSFLTNNTVNYKVINSKNHDNYANEIINSEKIEIDTEKLEQFYNEHKEKYDELSKRITSRPGLLLLLISVVACDKFVNAVAKLIYRKKHQQVINETEEYINKISEFIDNNIDDITLKVKNLSEMASKGYLSYEKGKNKNLSKLMFKLPVPYEFILNKYKDRTKLIEKVLKSTKIKTIEINVVDEEKNISLIHNIIYIDTDNDSYMYDCNLNEFLIFDNELKSSNPKLKYLISKKSKIVNSIKETYQNNKEKIDKLNEDGNLLETSKYEEFYNKNQNEIDAITKKLILK